MPVKGMGIHRNETGSRKAIEVYTKLLEKNPGDLETRWLLNIACMTVGGYPKGVWAKISDPRNGR